MAVTDSVSQLLAIGSKYFLSDLCYVPLSQVSTPRRSLAPLASGAGCRRSTDLAATYFGVGFKGHLG